MINTLIFIGMFVSMITGIMLSRYVFAWMNLSGGIAMARKLHMLAAYWNFVLISVHLGLHWSMMIGRIRIMEKKAFSSGNILSLLRWVGRIVAVVIAVYGGYQFMQENISQYLLGTIQFAFFDFRQSVYIFVLRYLAIMECIVCITYYLRKWLLIIKTQRKKSLRNV